MKEENENTRKAPLSGEDAHHPRHIHRMESAADAPVEVDSAAFFDEAPSEPPQEPAPETDEPTRVVPEEPTRIAAPADEEPTKEAPMPPESAPDAERAPLPGETPPPPKAPAAKARGGAKDDGAPHRGGKIMLILQAVLSVLALIQLWRTQMLPALYLVIFAVLLTVFWFVVRRCMRYRGSGAVASVFSGVLCVVLAVGCVWAQQGLAALNSMAGGLLTGSEANQITKEPFIVYLSGVDTRGELTENARSDVNILAVVNPTTKRVALVNTPRDYYVDLAGTSSKDKLTHAGLYGVETSMATLGNLYGVDVDHYIRINFAGFISIVDALGGVDVYSDYAFTSVGSPGYYDPTTFVEGWNHLDGKAALAFARERHAFASGDVQRGINQMKVIDAMLNKIKSPALLMSFSKLLDAAADCFVTSLSSDQISALVRMQLGDFAEWQIESYTVTGSSGSSTKCYSAQGQKLYVMVPDESSVNEAKALMQSVLGGEEAAEGAASSQSSGEHSAYSATGDPNAGGTPSADSTPVESEITLPDSTVTEEPAESAAADLEAAASTELPVEEAPAASDSDTAASGEAPAGSWPSQSEVEQAASSFASALGDLFGALSGSASTGE